MAPYRAGKIGVRIVSGVPPASVWLALYHGVLSDVPRFLHDQPEAILCIEHGAEWGAGDSDSTIILSLCVAGMYGAASMATKPSQQPPTERDEIVETLVSFVCRGWSLGFFDPKNVAM